MKTLMLIILSFCALNANAQTDELRKKYDEFRLQAQNKYHNFRDEANKQYAEFMKQAWQQYNILPAIPKPKDEEVPPVVLPKEDEGKPIESSPIPIKETITPPKPKPHPVPVAPIEEQPQTTDEYVTFRFFGTDCKVRFNDDERFTLKRCDDNALSEAWDRLSGEGYNNTIRDCLDLRIRMNLCDWAYLNMLSTMAEACLGNSNEATMLTAYIYCQSGYKMRIGRTDTKIYLLYASEHNIFGFPYFNLDGEHFYSFKCNEKSMKICNASMPKERPLSLLIQNIQTFSYQKTEARTLQAKRYPEIKVQTNVNRNLIEFYNTYPTSEFGNDFMTQWAIYANTPMEQEINKSLYPALREKLKGMDKKESAERLLNFVQTAFVYEYDDKVWGHDRAFFAEETLYYPYCDCEDRSILFSHMIRDLLDLDVILVYYPGHLATAVCFDRDVKGDYITLNGRRFVVCDPTYIGAPVGMTMPDMNNKEARVILLNRD